MNGRRASTSRRITPELAIAIFEEWEKSEINQHDLASRHFVNQGRVCEIVKRHWYLPDNYLKKRCLKRF